MNKLNLVSSLLIAKGGERNCYVHPEDNSKVIKIIHKKGKHNNQNELELKYINFLKKKKIPLSHVTNCYGKVNTNFGEGMVFDRVMDFDNNPSKSFRYMIAYKLLEESSQILLLKDLKLYLEKNKVLFVDNSMTNIFYQRLSINESRLVIVDGLGAKRKGLKFKLYFYLPFYKNYKIWKQWQKLMKLYKKDIRRIKDGSMPMHRL